MVTPMVTDKYLVSSCLVGLCTRYDACLRANTICLNFLRDKFWLPVCPEQLGGLPTPRPRSILRGGNGHDVLAGKARVMSEDGRDVSAQFILGARQVLQLAKAQDIHLAILKAKSPSCGVNQNIGVTAALLLEHGLQLTEY